jgi:hypothetical protein
MKEEEVSLPWETCEEGVVSALCGAQDFFLTCDDNRERQAMNEAFSLLDTV